METGKPVRSIQLVLPIFVTLYENATFLKEPFLKIPLICCVVPEPGCLTSVFPEFVCSDL